jgi:hypothetical protein
MNNEKKRWKCEMHPNRIKFWKHFSATRLTVLLPTSLAPERVPKFANVGNKKICNDEKEIIRGQGLKKREMKKTHGTSVPLRPTALL